MQCSYCPEPATTRHFADGDWHAVCHEECPALIGISLEEAAINYARAKDAYEKAVDQHDRYNTKMRDYQQRIAEIRAGSALPRDMQRQVEAEVFRMSAAHEDELTQLRNRHQREVEALEARHVEEMGAVRKKQHDEQVQFSQTVKQAEDSYSAPMLEKLDKLEQERAYYVGTTDLPNLEALLRNLEQAEKQLGGDNKRTSEESRSPTKATRGSEEEGMRSSSVTWRTAERGGQTVAPLPPTLSAPERGGQTVAPLPSPVVSYTTPAAVPMPTFAPPPGVAMTAPTPGPFSAGTSAPKVSAKKSSTFKDDAEKKPPAKPKKSSVERKVPLWPGDPSTPVKNDTLDTIRSDLWSGKKVVPNLKKNMANELASVLYALTTHGAFLAIPDTAAKRTSLVNAFQALSMAASSSQSPFHEILQALTGYVKQRDEDGDMEQITATTAGGQVWKEYLVPSSKNPLLKTLSLVPTGETRNLFLGRVIVALENLVRRPVALASSSLPKGSGKEPVASTEAVPRTPLASSSSSAATPKKLASTPASFSKPPIPSPKLAPSTSVLSDKQVYDM